MAPEKKDQIKNIFKPGTQVVLMIEQSFLRCIARNAMVYDCNHSKREIIVSSGEPMISRNMKRQKIFLTALVNREFELKTRLGIRVEISPSLSKNSKKRHFLSVFYGTTKYFPNKINVL